MDERSGQTVTLTKNEEREVRRRTGLRAAVVFETVRREGEAELRRPAAALAFSGLAAGLSMGFSLVATGIIRAGLTAAPWRVLLENAGYTLGFLIVVMGRQQLFSENTVTAVLPLLDDPNKRQTALRVLRLWAIVLAANLVGVCVFAYVTALTDVFPPHVRAAFLQLSAEAIKPTFGTILLRGIFAGWLIALMVWLLPAADASRVLIVLIITYIVGAAGLSHIIAGSVEVLYGVAVGTISWATYLLKFLLPVFIGNVIGGVALVSLLNYGQVAPEAVDTGS
ncbi:formate/nitrite transporter family protein [bacterium]|nr:MAG: formate/nitrite transporter family protein [bacterium]